MTLPAYPMPLPEEDFDFGAHANLVNEHEQFVQAHGGRRQRDEGEVWNCLRMC